MKGDRFVATAAVVGLALSVVGYVVRAEQVAELRRDLAAERADREAEGQRFLAFLGHYRGRLDRLEGTPGP